MNIQNVQKPATISSLIWNADMRAQGGYENIPTDNAFLSLVNRLRTRVVIDEESGYTIYGVSASDESVFTFPKVPYTDGHDSVFCDLSFPFPASGSLKVVFNSSGSSFFIRVLRFFKDGTSSKELLQLESSGSLVSVSDCVRVILIPGRIVSSYKDKISVYNYHFETFLADPEEEQQGEKQLE